MKWEEKQGDSDMNIDLSQIIGLFFNKFKAIKEKINSIDQIH